jgi:phosphatidylglycerol lysyltransferase
VGEDSVAFAMELLLLKYGYLVLFLGVFLEGEAFLLAGSFLSSQGYFDLSSVVLIGLAANTLGAQFYYMAARARGRRWFEDRFGSRPRYQRVLGWISQYGNWLIVVSRFIFGFRIVIPAACGAFGMPMARFLLLNLIAGIVWVIPTVLVGFYFGQSIAKLLEEARSYGTGLILAGILSIAAFHGLRRIHRIREAFQHFEWSDLHGLVPFLMGSMAFLNIAAAVWPLTQTSLGEIREWLPFEITEESRLLMLFAGIALLQVTRSLARRREFAWYVAVISLSVSLLLHATRGLDFQNSLVSGLLLIYLIRFRRRFYARSDPASLFQALAIAPLMLMLIFLYGATGLYSIGDQFEWQRESGPLMESIRIGILIVTPAVTPETAYAARFLASLQIAGWAARIYLLILLLRPVVMRDRLEAPAEAVADIFQKWGTHPLSAFAIQPDKHHLLVAGGQGLVAYAKKGHIAVACGDPLVSDDLFTSAADEFRNHCQRHGWNGCVFLAAEERLPAYHSLKMQTMKVADEAIVDLSRFQRARAGVEVQRYDRSAGADALIDEQLEEVSEEWLQIRHLGEMGFTLGHFDLESLSAGPVFVLGTRYYVEAFCAWLPYNKGQAVVLDLIRQRRTSPKDTVRMLMEQSLAMLKKAGYAEASLGTDLFARAEAEQFGARFEPRYLVYPGGANVGRIRKALAAVQSR